MSYLVQEMKTGSRCEWDKQVYIHMFTANANNMVTMKELITKMHSQEQATRNEIVTHIYFDTSTPETHCMVRCQVCIIPCCTGDILSIPPRRGLSFYLTNEQFNCQ